MTGTLARPPERAPPPSLSTASSRREAAPGKAKSWQPAHARRGELRGAPDRVRWRSLAGHGEDAPAGVVAGDAADAEIRAAWRRRRGAGVGLGRVAPTAERFGLDGEPAEVDGIRGGVVVDRRRRHSAAMSAWQPSHAAFAASAASPRARAGRGHRRGQGERVTAVGTAAASLERRSPLGAHAALASVSPVRIDRRSTRRLGLGSVRIRRRSYHRRALKGRVPRLGRRLPPPWKAAPGAMEGGSALAIARHV